MDCFLAEKLRSLAAAFDSRQLNAPIIQRAMCRFLSSDVRTSAGSGNSLRRKAGNSSRPFVCGHLDLLCESANDLRMLSLSSWREADAT